MIEYFELENYRCFRSASLKLGPLTVLVGPNATGKTSLLKALTGEPIGAQDTWQRNPGLITSLHWRKTGESLFRVQLESGRETGSRPAAQYVHLDPRELRGPRQVQEAERLSVTGDNLVNVIATLARKEEDRLATELATLVPVVRDVTRRPASSPGMHRLMFQDRWSGVWYDADQVSDGTLLALGLLVLRYQVHRPWLVAIEEPEHGLHPYLLGELVTMLRKLTTGELGSPLQIVVATQSAELLEFLDPSEVRFLSRNSEDGSVAIDEAPTDSDKWREAYEAHQRSLGSLWLSGTLGGIPHG